MNGCVAGGWQDSAQLSPSARQAHGRAPVGKSRPALEGEKSRSAPGTLIVRTGMAKLIVGTLCACIFCHPSAHKCTEHLCSPHLEIEHFPVSASRQTWNWLTATIHPSSTLVPADYASVRAAGRTHGPVELQQNSTP